MPKNELHPAKPTAVLKFGGAALSSIEQFSKIAEFIEKVSIAKLTPVAVITSAMAGVTNELISYADQIEQPKLDASKQATPRLLCHREQDLLISSGDRISASLLAIALNRRGVLAQSFTGSQAGIITTTDHSIAKILEIKPWRVEKAQNSGVLPVIAGFQGVSTDLDVTTLGRGGSDITAVAIAIAMKAQSVAFFKDVPGLYPSDPKKTKPNSLEPLREISYEKALELIQPPTYAIHPRAIKLAMKHEIPIFFGSFSDVDCFPGTTIGPSCTSSSSTDEAAIQGRALQASGYEA